MASSESDDELEELIKNAVKRKKDETRREVNPAPGMWHCEACTFLNHKDLVECEMCEKARQLFNRESAPLLRNLASGNKQIATKVKLTRGADENCSRAKLDAIAKFKALKSSAKNPCKIRPVTKFVPRPTIVAEAPKESPSYPLDDVYTTLDEPVSRPEIPKPVAKKVPKLTVKKQTRPKLDLPSNPLDKLVPLGPKKQKLSPSEAAPFKNIVEKRRENVLAKRSKLEKLENKPNLMLKSIPETDKTLDPHTKTARTMISSSASSSNLSPHSKDRRSPIPAYYQSVLTSNNNILSQPKTNVTALRNQAVKNDPLDISDGECLNIWSIVYPMVKWNPSWLQEALKASEPPPLIESQREPKRLKSSYDFFLEYYEIMHSPVLFEMWESLLRDVREKQQKTFDQRLAIAAVETVAEDPRLWRLNCDYLCEDSPEASFPKEGDFVEVLVPTFQKEGATHPSFAWIDSMDKIRVRQDTFFNPILDNLYGKTVWSGGRRTALNIKLKVIIHSYCDTSVDIHKPLPCRWLSCLVGPFRQYQGLVSMTRSSLRPHLLKPFDPEVFRPTLPPNPFKTTATDSTYNPSQTRAIQASVNIMFQSQTIPKFLLLQGPPGTGKSHTILGIIATFFENCEINHNTPRLLVCAPSNAGVDEIMRRLIALKRKSSNSRISSLNLVRAGMNSSVHPDVEEITLDSLMRGSNEDGKDEPSMSDKWVLEELSIRSEDVKKEIENLKNKRRTLKESGNKGEFREVESKLIKLMDEEKEIDFQKSELSRKARATESMTSKKANIKNDNRNDKMTRIHILKTAHVIGCTLNYSGADLMTDAFGKDGKRPQVFSCVIIDEACQSVELDCLIPLQYGVSKVIAVGDPEQLPATVRSKKSQELNFGCSLFERLYKLFKTSSPELFPGVKSYNPVLLLDTQYRMHPEICSFPSKHIYGGLVKTDQSVVERDLPRRCPFRPLLFFDLVDSKEQSDPRGSSGGPSISNLFEASFTVALCKQIVSLYSPSSICVITPYKKQMSLIQNRMRQTTFRDSEGNLRSLGGLIEVGTVDGFQGREKEFVVLSCVRAQSDSGSIGFLENRQRMNVALTRAKNGLYVLGHASSLISNKNWGAFIEDAHRRHSVLTVLQNTSIEVAVKMIEKDSVLPNNFVSGVSRNLSRLGSGRSQPQCNTYLQPPPVSRRPTRSKFKALRNQSNESRDGGGRDYGVRGFYSNFQQPPNPVRQGYDPRNGNSRDINLSSHRYGGDDGVSWKNRLQLQPEKRGPPRQDRRPNHSNYQNNHRPSIPRLQDLVDFDGAIKSIPSKSSVLVSDEAENVWTTTMTTTSKNKSPSHPSVTDRRSATENQPHTTAYFPPNKTPPSSGKSEEEEESPISRAKRINEELRNRFSNWEEDDDDAVTEAPPALEIQRLSDQEEGEIFSEDEDSAPTNPEPQFTDDEEPMEEECDEAGEPMDVGLGNTRRVVFTNRFDQTSRGRISPIRFP